VDDLISANVFLMLSVHWKEMFIQTKQGHFPWSDPYLCLVTPNT